MLDVACDRREAGRVFDDSGREFPLATERETKPAQHLVFRDRDVPWWIQSSEVEQVAREEQHARYVGDPWDLLISEHIATRSEVSIDEILADVIKLERARWGQSEQNRVARCLRSQGFVRFQLRVGKKRAWRYRKETPVTG